MVRVAQVVLAGLAVSVALAVLLAVLYLKIYSKIYLVLAKKEAVRGGQRQPEQGSDLRYDMEITLEEAAHGTQKEIKIPTLVACDHVMVLGKPELVRKPVQLVVGMVLLECSKVFLQQTCQHVMARSSYWSPCTKCRGQGRCRKQELYQLKFQLGLTLVTELELQVRVRQVKLELQLVIYMFRFMFKSIQF